MDDLVAAIHDFALAGDEHVLTEFEKDSLRLAGGTGKAVKLQWDRRCLRRVRRLT